MLAIGGLRGIIKIINCISQTVVRVCVACVEFSTVGGVVCVAVCVTVSLT